MYTRKAGGWVRSKAYSRAQGGYMVKMRKFFRKYQSTTSYARRGRMDGVSKKGGLIKNGGLIFDIRTSCKTPWQNPPKRIELSSGLVL